MNGNRNIFGKYMSPLEIANFKNLLCSENEADKRRAINTLLFAPQTQLINELMMDSECCKVLKNTPNTSYENLFFFVFKFILPTLSFQEIMERLKKETENYPVGTGMIVLTYSEENRDFLLKLQNDKVYLPSFDTVVLAKLYNKFPSKTLKDNLKDVLFANLKAELGAVYGFDKLNDEMNCNDINISNNNTELSVTPSGNLKEDEIFREDLIQAALFLADMDKVKAELAKLEAKLEDLAGNRFDPARRMMEGFEEGQRYKHHKLLSNFLYQWTEENHFGGFAKFYTELEPATFFEVLEKKMLIKDIFFRGSDHGEWSHYLQWYCLVEFIKEQELAGTPYFKSRPEELLAWIGRNKNKYWSKTFEVPPKTTTFVPKDDSRDVVDFYTYLASQECAKEFPVLHQLLVGRNVLVKKPPSPVIIEKNDDDQDQKSNKKRSLDAQDQDVEVYQVHLFKRKK